MIAILGATGTIGRSLARALSSDPRGLVLFARRPERLIGEPLDKQVSLQELNRFSASDFDLVINAIGAGDPGSVAAIGAAIIDVTEQWDRRVLDTMGSRTRYVFLSSGAVYGSGLVAPVEAHSQISLPVNALASVPPYILAKLAAEARHRHLPDRSILDVRIFGYADVTLPHDGRFFMCELARSIRTRAPFPTSSKDMVRDYAGRQELVELIASWERSGAANASLDLYTKAATHKHEILKLAVERFGVVVEYHDDVVAEAVVPQPVYASRNYAAAALGYVPGRSALGVVTDFLDRISASVAREVSH